MTKDEIKNNIQIMQAYLDGKQIQWKHKNLTDNVWFTVVDPTFSFAYYDYRIKPEPVIIKYRRYIFKDQYGFCIFNHTENEDELPEDVEAYFGFYEWIDSDWITEEIEA